MISTFVALLVNRYKVMQRCWMKKPERRPTFRELHSLLVTFQKSLTRRKTLMTTLASFASVSAVDDLKPPPSAKLPNFNPQQNLQVMISTGKLAPQTESKIVRDFEQYHDFVMRLCHYIISRLNALRYGKFHDPTSWSSDKAHSSLSGCVMTLSLMSSTGLPKVTSCPIIELSSCPQKCIANNSYMYQYIIHF